MEAFLSTLPPYVHDFLGKHPPTDVFNLLRELVCFAVLYSNDRERIKTCTDALLKKQNQSQQAEREQVVLQEKVEDTVVPESHIMIEPIAEETEIEIKDSSVVAAKEAEIITKPSYNIRTGELIQKDNKSTMPNTFPEWWGHQESEPQHYNSRKEVNHDSNKSTTEAYGTSWISWDSAPATTTASNRHQFRMERAKSQIIPDLRSYPEENNAKMTSSQTAPANNSLKHHSTTLNIKSTTSPARSATNSPSPRTKATSPPLATSNSTKASRRLSAPVCDSPTSTSGSGQSKFVLTATKTQKLRELNSRSPSQSNSTETSNAAKTPVRSASVVLKQPRQNAAMRARAEHARLQQEEFSRKKSETPLASSTSLRLKQRVNSGIDWDTIKRDRRNTVSEETVAKKE